MMSLYRLLILLPLIALTIAPQTSLAEWAEVKEIRTNSDHTVWFMEDDFLPIVSVSISFTRAGYAHDPEGKQGLAVLATSLLDEGAGEYDSLAFKTKLEALATNISFSVSEDSVFITLETLTEHFDEAIELLSLALTSPQFSTNSVERIRRQLIASIERNRENPSYLASRLLDSHLFAGHPYSKAKLGTKESLNAITREDLQQYISKHFTQKNIAVSVAGAIKKKRLLKRLDGLIANLAPESLNQPLPEVTLNTSSMTLREEYPVPQSTVLFALPGYKREHPDYMTAYLLNYILGGGSFQSRLVQRIREDNGLVYSTYSYLSYNDASGILAGYAGTQNENVDKVINLIKEEIELLATNGVTQDELQLAKNYIIQSFPLKLTRNRNLSSMIGRMQLDKLGTDYLNRREEEFKKITLEDVNRVAKSLLDSNQLLFVVVGGKADYAFDPKQ